MSEANLTNDSPLTEQGTHLSQPRQGPRWDGALRELWFGDQLVKRFRQPAPSQELVLAAFQEEGWPSYMDDPLPPRAEQDVKARLRITIQNLNRNQRTRSECPRMSVWSRSLSNVAGR